MTGALMNKLTALLAAASTVAMAATGAVAQTQDELVKAFSGEWFVFAPAFRSGSSECRIVLDNQMDAQATGCATPLVGLGRWNIENGPIRLLDAAETELAVMGGNQQRITGTLSDSDQGLIVERAQGDGASIAISNALARHKCYFLGFTQDCAPQEALSPPIPSAEDPALSRVEILVTLNVRNQPRRDAPVVGILDQGLVITLDYCTSASDGVWCRAIFGTETGWLAKTALRQNEWPIVTYRNTTRTP